MTGTTVITLLPGSRLQEVKRMLPIFSKTVEQLKDAFTDLSTIIPLAPNRQVEAYINREIQSWPVPNILTSGSSLGKKYDAFSVCQSIKYLLFTSCLLLPQSFNTADFDFKVGCSYYLFSCIIAFSFGFLCS